ncbi:MAG: nucleoside hydrolase [Bryobacteraceae bacterium]|nr:nucleoside hydrolase [Bryobacteraceae bacterium]
MQFQGGKPPIGVVFDSDFGNRIDSVLALALLYGFDGRNEARVISVTTSKSNLKSAAYCDAIGRFYAAGGFGRTLPVGMADDNKNRDDSLILTVPLEKKNAEGKPAYPHGIQKLNDTAIVEAVMRNALTAQYDGNCMVVLAGPATNLARLLALAGTKQWIERKVKYLVVAGGAFPEGPPEDHVKVDVESAKKIFTDWPGPVYVAGSEVSNGVLFPGASIEKDFAYAPSHPVADAYRANKPGPYDAPTGDMSAVLYAVRPQEGYFKLSDPGTITVLDDGRTKFTAGADGRHRYLIADPAQKERIVKAYTEVASAKPVPRQRLRPPQVDVKKDVKTDVAKPPVDKPDQLKPPDQP